MATETVEIGYQQNEDGSITSFYRDEKGKVTSKTITPAQAKKEEKNADVVEVEEAVVEAPAPVKDERKANTKDKK